MCGNDTSFCVVAIFASHVVCSGPHQWIPTRQICYLNEIFILIQHLFIYVTATGCEPNYHTGGNIPFLTIGIIDFQSVVSVFCFSLTLFLLYTSSLLLPVRRQLNYKHLIYVKLIVILSYEKRTRKDYAIICSFSLALAVFAPLIATYNCHLKYLRVQRYSVYICGSVAQWIFFPCRTYHELHPATTTAKSNDIEKRNTETYGLNF